ncbi:MAG: hypothetical protein K9L85_03125 [Candidatus Peribacteraceae bacterium]|nr:hypothetical protein [Candidatus Peribacteraceae bacterium]
MLNASKKILLALACLAVFIYADPALAWSDLGGGDHGGADWSPANGTSISGEHTNIGTFTVSGTAYVNNNVTIDAENINIIGTLNAAGRGYLGGYGGSGGSAEGSGGSGSNGQGTYRGSGGGGGGGTSSRYGNGASGGSGSNGGYRAYGANGDSSTDESVYVGSGGGGGGGGGSGARSGCNMGYPAGSGGGGGAGARGGGYVKLIASGELSVSGSVATAGNSNAGNGGSASTLACGSLCRDCNHPGGSGGNPYASGSRSGGAPVYADYPWAWRNGSYGCANTLKSGSEWVAGRSCTSGGYGGSGGTGAGGGVLLKGSTVSVSGTIDARGGSGTTNGGTLKVFSCTLNYTGSKSLLGRYFESQRTDCYFDIGLRVYDGASIVKIAAEPSVTNSALHIHKNGTTYALALVATSDPAASKIHVQTESGIKALREL